MAAAAVANPPVTTSGESKNARKKKAKADASTVNGTDRPSPAVPQAAAKDDSTAATDADTSNAEHPYLKELQKNIRNVNKKLTAMSKLDAIIAENPGVSLDNLVAQRKINQDQKAAALKKPQLLSQLADLEERQEHYRKLDSDYQIKFSKQRDDLTSQHKQELSKIREEARTEAVGTSSSELRQKLLTFSQFLRAAAAKRTVEDEADTDESRAFEGALLLVYGGDEKAVDTALNLIDGSDQQVPSIEGVDLPITFAQIKKASLEHGPFQAEEAWVDDVAEATGGEVHPGMGELTADGTDPTITHAGLTELEAPLQPNGGHERASEQTTAANVSSGGSGNQAAERWNVDAAGASAGAENGLEESYEVIPRPSEEVDIPAQTPLATSQQPQSTSWADEPSAYDTAATGNAAGESWDTKAPGEEKDSAWDGPAAPADGFQEVPGRTRGRGRGRGDGEFRGRGGRRGNFRSW